MCPYKAFHPIMMEMYNVCGGGAALHHEIHFPTSTFSKKKKKKIIKIRSELFESCCSKSEKTTKQRPAVTWRR